MEDNPVASHPALALYVSDIAGHIYLPSGSLDDSAATSLAHLNGTYCSTYESLGRLGHGSLRQLTIQTPNGENIVQRSRMISEVVGSLDGDKNWLLNAGPSMGMRRPQSSTQLIATVVAAKSSQIPEARMAAYELLGSNEARNEVNASTAHDEGASETNGNAS